MVSQTVKNLPAMWESQVQSLSWEDPLEKGMAIHSSILAWRIPWTEEPDKLQFMGSQRVKHDWKTNTSTFQKEMILIISESLHKLLPLFGKYLVFYVITKWLIFICYLFGQETALISYNIPGAMITLQIHGWAHKTVFGPKEIKVKLGK